MYLHTHASTQTYIYKQIRIYSPLVRAVAEKHHRVILKLCTIFCIHIYASEICADSIITSVRGLYAYSYLLVFSSKSHLHALNIYIYIWLSKWCLLVLQHSAFAPSKSFASSNFANIATADVAYTWKYIHISLSAMYSS